MEEAVEEDSVEEDIGDSVGEWTVEEDRRGVRVDRRTMDSGGEQWRRTVEEGDGGGQWKRTGGGDSGGGH